jgi:calcineurin-like phosphoesterase family protein
MIVVIEENLNNVFITADQHFHHKNIISFCDRPFTNVLDMDETLINNWNKVVKPQDWVIHLGDFTLEGGRIAQEYFSQLNGDICLLSYPWHHDKRWLKTKLPLKSKSGFDIRLWPSMVILEIPQLGRDGYYALTITLCHYPLAVWDREHYGGWHLHAHSHGKYEGEGYILDVGVDIHNFTPISLGNILVKMRELGWT